MSNSVMNKTNATEESFWSMLSKSGNEFAIYIPRIQRDYAQGRQDGATKQIRDTFVNDIFNSVVSYKETGDVLDVNFIYVLRIKTSLLDKRHQRRSVIKWFDILPRHTFGT